MTQWTKVLFDGPKRTDDPIPLDVFDMATDAVIQRKQSYLSVLVFMYSDKIDVCDVI